MMKTRSMSRRQFLHTAALGSVAISAFATPAICSSKSPNSKLSLAFIGVGGQARSTMGQMKDENYYALCDVSKLNLDKAAAKWPDAKKFADYREMLAKDADKIDVVVVSTPDHTHAPASIAAMKLKKHCYCEKPLAHNLGECRAMQDTARKNKLVTQLGTQPNAFENYYKVVEWIQSGIIGEVREVHVWTQTGDATGYVVGVGGTKDVGIPLGTGWGQRADQPLPTGQAVPETLNWDLWLGTAQTLPYHPCYVPANWRRWWAFGSGQLGDFGCHFMNLPFWALNLTDCRTVEAWGPKVNPYACPEYLKVRYTFPIRRNFPACTLTWYDGANLPEVDSLLAKYKIPAKRNGMLFVGNDGVLFANYQEHEVYPIDKFQKAFKPSPWIPRSKSHYTEFLNACRENDPSMTKCPFSYGGRLTETILLGTISYRTGKKLTWDADNL
ncbi:MAG: Gfo/Idh/MocA family oxidoreductase [Thermoguttaceae bacterium]|nr:Gfo/Idh/MocA family oxidoreductase [Thermoguttaceae bacterium]